MIRTQVVQNNLIWLSALPVAVSAISECDDAKTWSLVVFRLRQQAYWISLPINYGAVRKFFEGPRLTGTLNACFKIVLEIVPTPGPLIIVGFQVLHDHVGDPPNHVRISDSLIDTVQIVRGANKNDDDSNTSNS